MSANTEAEVRALRAAQAAQSVLNAQLAQSEGHAQYLTFMLGGEMFAIGILAIKEIIEYNKLTTVPMMPRYVRGVINLRGAVVPVIDLAARFGRAATEVSRRTCIVIVEIAVGEGRQVVGLLVDAVNEVLDIPPAEIEPAPSFGANVRSDFIAGQQRFHSRICRHASPNPQSPSGRIIPLCSASGIN